MLKQNQKSFFSLGKIYYFKYFGSLFIILIGIFLCPKIAYLSSITPENIIEFTNQERVKNNLNTLTFNSTLQQAAEAKAQAILANGQFQHNIGTKRFSDWIKEAGYKYSYVGENLAVDFVTSEGVINAWLNSPAHKKNILNSYYEEIGVAVDEGIFDGQNTILVVQIFGASPLGAAKGEINNFQQQSYTPNKNYLPYYLSSSEQSLAQEKLLTHTASGYLDSNIYSPEKSENFSIKYKEDGGQTTLNNFFAQYSFYPIFKYLNLAISTILLLFIFYIYFFCFSRLSNIL